MKTGQGMSGPGLLSGFVLIAAAGLLFQLMGVLHGADMKILDAQFGALRTHFPRAVERDVVLVAIDESTRDRLPEPLTLWHRHLGRFLEAMAIARPSVVGLDILLPERSYDFLLEGYDSALRQGIVSAGRASSVIYGVSVKADGEQRQIFGRFIETARRVAEISGTHFGLGAVLWETDGDEIIRRFVPRLGENIEAGQTLSGQMAVAVGADVTTGYIDYAIGAPFEYVPFHQVLDWLDSGAEQQLRDRFSGRPVILGTVLPFTDRHEMPVNLAGWEEEARDLVPGMLFHGQALRVLLNSGMIKPVRTAWLVLLTLVAAGLWFFGARYSRGLVLLLVFAVLTGLLSTTALFGGMLLPVSAVLFTALLAVLGRGIAETALHMVERRRLRHTFGSYVSPQIMDEILKGGLKPGLGGELREICVLFADVRGFTTLSEGMPPQAIIGLLNRYFDRMTTAIHGEGGTIDKFMGDGIMAFFGAPNDLGSPGSAAFRAAQAMLEQLQELNHELEQEATAPLRIGIGLHEGSAVVGHVGSHSRHEYTAIGDVVNVASRLEGLTKSAGYPVVCSQRVVQLIGDSGRFDALGEMPIKGHTPVQVYGWPGRHGVSDV